MSEISRLDPDADPLIDVLSGETRGWGARCSGREAIRLRCITALRRLPPRQRAVLLLRDALGIPAAEVAELLGTSEATVADALQRARRALELG